MMRPLKLRRDLTDVLKEKDRQINMMTNQAHKFRDMCVEKDAIIKEIIGKYVPDEDWDSELMRRAKETLS